MSVFLIANPFCRGFMLANTCGTGTFSAFAYSLHHCIIPGGGLTKAGFWKPAKRPFGGPLQVAEYLGRYNYKIGHLQTSAAQHH